MLTLVPFLWDAYISYLAWSLLKKLKEQRQVGRRGAEGNSDDARCWVARRQYQYAITGGSSRPQELDTRTLGGRQRGHRAVDCNGCRACRRPDGVACAECVSFERAVDLHPATQSPVCVCVCARRACSAASR